MSVTLPDPAARLLNLPPPPVGPPPLDTLNHPRSSPRTGGGHHEKMKERILYGLHYPRQGLVPKLLQSRCRCALGCARNWRVRQRGE